MGCVGSRVEGALVTAAKYSWAKENMESRVTKQAWRSLCGFIPGNLLYISESIEILKQH